MRNTEIKQPRLISTHSFDVQDAIDYGVEKAVLIYNIKFWLEKNRANDNNYHDGHWWTFNSASAFESLFPYMNAKKINRLLKELEEAGVLISGNYNKKGYDRTKWYSTPCCASYPKNGKCISQKCEMDIPDLRNGYPKNEPPIPDINTDINSDINTYIKDNDDTDESNNQQVAVVDDSINISFDEFWNLYDYKKGLKSKAEKKWKSLKDSEREAVMQNLPLYKLSTPNKRYRKQPISYLNNKTWLDEILDDTPNNQLPFNSQQSNYQGNNSHANNQPSAADKFRAKLTGQANAPAYPANIRTVN